MYMDEFLSKCVLEKSPDYEPCTGLLFKGYSSTFSANGRIENRQGVKLLKKKSCKCLSCMGMLEEIEEAIRSNYLDLPAVIEEDAFYTARVVEISRDRETGMCDDWQVQIVKLPE